MPKIIDHDTHQAALALKAASYFSAKGYAGGTMRQIAEHLGVSKSALYHYFPSKEALFLASTTQVMEQVRAYTPRAGATRSEQLADLITEMSANFGAEMSLLFDYLRGMSPTDIRKDKAMQLAVTTYRAVVADIVGEADADAVLRQVLGKLLYAHLTGTRATT